MIEDDVLIEVRAAREAYAQLHHYDVRAMVADLQARNLAGDWQVVRYPPRRPPPVAVAAIVSNESLPQSRTAEPVDLTP